jgi:hypothetical protein
MFDESDLIHVYTRAQAIADGVLIDVTETANEAGIRYPVAITQAVWAEYVAIPDGVEGQDESGRLWDILWMLAVAIRRSREPGDTLSYQLYVRNDNRRPKLVTLKAVCGPADDGLPCITVMLPNED